MKSLLIGIGVILFVLFGLPPLALGLAAAIAFSGLSLMIALGVQP